MKKALITGTTGQDGSYLAELLLEKGYEVHGLKRRASSFNTDRVNHIYQDPQVDNRNFTLHYGDLTDGSNLTRLLKDVQPDEVYNLGAQSHVAVSFDTPEYTADVNGLGTLRLLEAIRLTPIGQSSITAKLMGFMPVTAFYLIMNPRAEARHLSRAKLRAGCVISRKGWRTVFT